MILKESRRERLKEWFDSNHYQHLHGSGHMFIEEKTKSHSWRIDCYVQNEAVCFRLEKKNGIQYLRQKKIADAVILEFLGQRAVRIHILECKKTVGSGAWKHIKSQFEGALLNALALLGILGIDAVQEVVFYTAYLRDRISPEQNPRPSTLKEDAGEWGIQWPADWLDDRVSILSISAAPHMKIQLSAAGEALKGEVALG